MNDEYYMMEAIRLSKTAAKHGNEPYGAILVKDGEIVFSNENQICTMHDPTFHAETGLVRRFCTETGITDLREYTMYSSCEPCFMCSGAIVKARLGRLVYAASNIDCWRILGKESCNCSRIVFEHSFWRPEVLAGVCREESLEVLRNYYAEHRGE